MRTARRLDTLVPFYVMECAKAAARIADSPECDPARGGEPMVWLNIGEPDFSAPPAVQRAAARALADGDTRYTQADGLPELREAIAGWYATRFSLDIDPSRIVVTAGASAALTLVCLALFEAGDEVLMPDPSYPCNRQFVAVSGATPRLVPTSAATRFQPDAAGLDAHWNERTRGVILASPSNPTGTSIAPAVLREIVERSRARGTAVVVDEIYLGLSYDDAFGTSALAHDPAGDTVISVNSFSKYFSMTGWRLGWLVLPSVLAARVETLAQHLYICPSTLAQRAALACFEPESIAEYERRRQAFRQRRDLIVPALDALGLTVPVRPDGAFYAWADCSAYNASSWDFAFDMMRRAHVALTPGRDFGPAHAERYVRLSLASSLADLQTAIERLKRELRRG
jgi:aspartate/methionine/tyrosine aminotransferase